MVAVACALAVTVPPAAADMLPCDQYDPTCTNVLPRTELYDLAPTGRDRDGLLLGHEAVADYELGVPAEATRIAYRSAGADGRTTVTAVVLTPGGEAPPGGWPVVAYAHGTSGSATLCAPSLMADLYHGSQLGELLRAGLAVVATDYAGLGGPGDHPVVAKDVLARNVTDALVAARSAVPDLSDVWVGYGHSQGGLAVLGVAEQQRQLRDPGYRGVVATAPPSQLPSWLETVVANPYAAGFVPMIVQGAAAQHRQLHVDRILTPEAVRRLPALDDRCLLELLATYADLTGSDLVTDRFARDPHLARALRAAEPGRRPMAGPVLLLHGDADSAVPVRFADALAETLVARQVDLDYRVYPDLEHDTYPGGPLGIDDGAMPDIVDWITTQVAAVPHPPG